jgi:hypothetical protein
MKLLEQAAVYVCEKCGHQVVIDMSKGIRSVAKSYDVSGAPCPKCGHKSEESE